MLSIFNINSKNKNINKHLKLYKKINNRLIKSVADYENILADKFLKSTLVPDYEFSQAIKIIRTELIEISDLVDNELEIAYEKSDFQFFKKYLPEIPKYSTIFSENNEEDSVYKNIDLFVDDKSFVQLPAFMGNDDIFHYIKDLHDSFLRVNELKEVIFKTENIIKEFKNLGRNVKIFDKSLAFHKEKLMVEENIFAKELHKIKMELTKTLNVVSLPIEIDLQTLFINAYLKKMIDHGILSKEIHNRRFVSSAPFVIRPYLNDLGFTLIQK